MSSDEAVLVLGFGGPRQRAETRPFVEAVLAGRGAPPGRVDQVIAQYDQVGGFSPYVLEAERLTAGLTVELRNAGWTGPVALAMRYGGPSIPEVLSALQAAGTRRLRVLPMTAFGGADAGARYLASLDGCPLSWRASGPFWDDPALVSAWVRACGPVDGGDVLLFSAHSVPVSAASPYQAEVASLAAAVAGGLGAESHQLGWQSRSGPPQQPWLIPSIEDQLRALASSGATGVRVLPVGFLCEHVEIRYDLGVAAARVAAELGLRCSVVRPPVADPDLLVSLSRRLLAL